MNPVVAEYRTLPTDTDNLGDTPENDRKCKLIEQLDDHANDADVSELLLDIMRNVREYDLARVEAIKVAGIYIEESCPNHAAVWAELNRIFNDESEDEMIRGWAERYVNLA
jgi:hypothetical protein